MSKVVLLGLPGDKELFMVDLEHRTVTTVPEGYVKRDALAPKASMKGVEFAMVMGGDNEAPSGKFDTVQMLSGQMQGLEIAMAMGGDSEAPSGKFDTVQMLSGKMHGVEIAMTMGGLVQPPSGKFDTVQMHAGQ